MNRKGEAPVERCRIPWGRFISDIRLRFITLLRADTGLHHRKSMQCSVKTAWAKKKIESTQEGHQVDKMEMQQSKNQQRRTVDEKNEKIME